MSVRGFRRLATELPLEQLRHFETEEDLEAALFGAAGLLPDSTMQTLLPEMEDRAQNLWHRWWTLGAPKIAISWNHASARPLNSPCRRLAAGVKWLRLTEFQPMRWLQKFATMAQSPRLLLDVLYQTDYDLPHWRGCQNFQTAVKPEAALLGHQRIADIIANVFLPALCASNIAGYTEEAASLAKAAFLMMPPMQGNRSLTEAAHRFLTPPSRSKEVLKRASHQQGLLDIYHNFCQNLGHDCSKCPFANIGQPSPPKQP